MLSALIIVGSERDFWERAKEMERYLRASVKLRHLAVTEGWNRSNLELQLPFMNYATRAGRQPFLLAYIGHGYKKKTGETGWSYGVKNARENLELSYTDLLGWLIESRDGPTLALNDCCYAGAFNDQLRNLAPQYAKVSAIAAAEPEGFCYGEMIDEVVESWKARQAYIPKIRVRDAKIKGHQHVKEERFGPDHLDHHFFPKPEKAKKAA